MQVLVAGEGICTVYNSALLWCGCFRPWCNGHKLQQYGHLARCIHLCLSCGLLERILDGDAAAFGHVEGYWLVLGHVNGGLQLATHGGLT